MIFPLKHIEQHLDDTVLLLSEQLYEQGFVSDLNEIERHLWTAKVVDKEVEIQISPTKVKAYTCECEDFKTNKICEHIGAALFALRRIIQTKAAVSLTQKPKTNKKSTTKRLTVNAILENANKEHVFAFIKAYAKSNRAFAMAFKARFAAVVPMDDNLEKYRQLLDANIKEGKLKNDTISYRGWQQLVKLCKELNGQVDDALALRDFQEASMILQAMIERITPVIPKTKGDSTVLKDFVVASFWRFEQLLNDQPAPALKEAIWEFCLNDAPKSTYRFNGITTYFFQLMHLISDDNEKVDKLIQSIDNQLDKVNHNQSDKANLLILKFNLLEKSDAKKQLEQFIKNNIESPEFLLFVADKMQEQQKYNQAKNLINQGLSFAKNPDLTGKLEEKLLEVAVLQNDANLVSELAFKRFISRHSFQFYDTLKAHYQGDWDQKVNDIIDTIQKLPFSMSKRDVLAQIYLTEERLDDLLEYVKNFKSLDLLQRYDKLLLTSHRKAIEQLYVEFLSTYLKNHLGRKPAIKAKGIIQHVFEIGEERLAERLVYKFREQFGDRQSLMEELSIFR